MLKIKDNVDLKELEKFGFEFDKKYKRYETKKEIVIPCYCYECENSEEYPTKHTKFDKAIGFIVEPRNRCIDRMHYGDFWHNDMKGNDFAILYDLIQAGLVEKVDD